MKHNRLLALTLAFLMCAVMLVGVIPTSVFAAKENFKSCGYIGIRNCAIPVAGEKPDFDVDECHPSQYTIMSVNWYKGYVSASTTMGGTETFQGGTVYIVEFEVWAKGSYYFTTDSNGNTTVVADISPKYNEYGEFDAQVMNVYGEDNTKYLTVRYTFPRTESMAMQIGSVEITDVVEPRDGDTPYYYGNVSNGALLTNVDWYHGSTKMGTKEKFVEGETYYVYFHLQARLGYEFATDKTSAPAPTGHRWPQVSATVNGKSAAVVYDTAYNSTEEHIIVGTSFVCGATRIISNVEIIGVTEPVAGADPNRYVKVGADTYKRTDLSNYCYSGGVAWMDGKGNYMRINQDKFDYSTAYTIEINLEPTGDYKFATDAYGYDMVTATVNGKEAETKLNNGVLTVTYKFKKTEGLEVSKVEVNDIDAPVAGAYPDYDATLGDKSYELSGISNDPYVKNNIGWHCETTGQWMRPGVDKFIGGYTYSVFFFLRSVDPYTFKQVDEYSYTVSGKVNGKAAQLEECDESDATIYYTFTAERLEVKKVEVTGIDAPKEGAYPDYDAILGDTTYAPMYTVDDAETKNSIMWYDYTTGDYLKVGADKFIGGHKYSVVVILKTTDNYTFEYVPATDSYMVDAKINGKAATIEECVEDSLIIYYDFECEKVVHTCSPKKIEEQKATCTENGKEAHYLCTECGKFYEDSKGTKEITDITRWGVINATGHSGGKATCKDKALCKVCGAPYGELEDHKWSTGWDYKDENGHAHKCKECEAHDNVVAHTPGETKCGKVTKCTECKAEYGGVVEHKWSATWDYTDQKGHAHVCSVCGERDTLVSHNPGPEATETSDQICNDCKYIIKPKKDHKHDLTKVKEKDATCTEAGNKQYYTCSGCDGIFSDSKGKEEITDKSTVIIPATGHDIIWKTTSSKHSQKCSAKGCGYVVEGSESTHLFDDDNVCTVCEYVKKSGANENDDTEEADTKGGEAEPEETNAPADKPGDKPGDKTDDKGDDTGDGMDGNTMWFIIGAALLFGVACLVVLIIVLTKKSKQK